LIDTHAHLDEIENLDSVLRAARDTGIQSVICVGQSPLSNDKVLNIARNYPELVFPALGLHPWEIHNLSGENIGETLDFIAGNSEKITAIGEIGLDYDKRVVKLTSKDDQKNILKRLLDIAVESDRPVSLHSRYAWKDCYDIVKGSGVKKAVFHWFTGLSSVLKEIIDSGYYISATPASEYHDEHRRAIRETPLQQLLLETDCPVTYRGMDKPSVPSDVLRSLKATAALKGLSEEKIAEQTTLNAVKLFRLQQSR